MKKRYKKATLDISIGAIVIIVIAFVVLGLGLVLTKQIFSKAREQIPEIFEVAKLGKEPTAETPLTIRKEISIKRGDTKQLDVGYYNKDGSTHEDVRIDILNCLSVATGKSVDDGLAEGETSKAPSMTSLMQKVSSGESVGYLVYATEKGLNAGEYICEVVAMTPAAGTAAEEIYERVQVSLTVTT